jgi:hypothetical protein
MEMRSDRKLFWKARKEGSSGREGITTHIMANIQIFRSYCEYDDDTAVNRSAFSRYGLDI